METIIPAEMMISVGLSNTNNYRLDVKLKTVKHLVSLLTVSDSCCHTKCSTVLAYMVPTSAAGMIP